MRPIASFMSVMSLMVACGVVGTAPIVGMAAQPATKPAVDSAAQSEHPAPSSSTPVDGQATDLTNPTDDPNPRTPDHTNPDPITGLHNRGGGVGPRQMQPELSKEDIDDAMTFLKANSHLRYAALEAMTDSDPKKNRFKNLAARNYNQLIRPIKNDPDLYNLAIQRTKVEDEVFGLVTSLHKPTGDKEALKTQLRDKVTELVKISLQERELRLNKLEKTVAKEKETLAADNADPSKLIDARMNSILEAGNRGIFGANPGGARPRQGQQRQPGDGPP